MKVEVKDSEPWEKKERIFRQKNSLKNVHVVNEVKNQSQNYHGPAQMNFFYRVLLQT